MTEEAMYISPDCLPESIDYACAMHTECCKYKFGM